MIIRDLFSEQGLSETIARVNKLTPNTKAAWGTMNVAQMLAHVNVTYDMAFTDKYPKPNAFLRFILKLAVKKSVVGPKPYIKNQGTAPQFVIKGERDFEREKKILVDYLIKTQQLGSAHFENKEYRSFGQLTSNEWNILFSKHLDHHLTQFGV